MNHYDLLEVSPNASPEVVRAAYKSLMQRHHPDKNPTGGGMAADRAALIARAYDVLSDPEARAAYDAQLRRERTAAATAPASAGASPRRPYAHAAPQRKPVSPYLQYGLRFGAVVVVAGGLLVALKQVLRPSPPQAVVVASGPLSAPVAPERAPEPRSPDAPSARAPAPAAPAVEPAAGPTPAPAKAAKPITVSLLDTNMHVLVVRRPRVDGGVRAGEDDDDGAPSHEITIPAISVQVGTIDGDRFAALLTDRRSREELVMQLNNQLGQQLRLGRLRVEREAYLAALVRDILRELTGTRGMAPPGAVAMEEAPDTNRYGIAVVTLPEGYSVRP